MRKCTYLGGKRAKNFELMTKKRSSEILADEKTYFWRMKRHFWGKVTWKSVTCEMFLDNLKKF